MKNLVIIGAAFAAITLSGLGIYALFDKDDAAEQATSKTAVTLTFSQFNTLQQNVLDLKSEFRSFVVHQDSINSNATDSDVPGVDSTETKLEQLLQKVSVLESGFSASRNNDTLIYNTLTDLIKKSESFDPSKITADIKYLRGSVNTLNNANNLSNDLKNNLPAAYGANLVYSVDGNVMSASKGKVVSQIDNILNFYAMSIELSELVGKGLITDASATQCLTGKIAIYTGTLTTRLTKSFFEGDVASRDSYLSMIKQGDSLEFVRYQDLTTQKTRTAVYQTSPAVEVQGGISK
jgi:uncharacterized protein YfkK (UPF0435 family)